MEWIQGEGGVVPLSHEFTRKARADLADQLDALLVFDESNAVSAAPGTYFGYQLIRVRRFFRMLPWRPSLCPAACLWVSSLRMRAAAASIWSGHAWLHFWR